MRSIHLPVWLGALSPSRAVTFAALFAFSSMTRAILITVVPLQAHALLGDAQKVSILYFAISLVGLSTSLTIPWLVHRMRRRRVFTLGALGLVLAAVLLASRGLPGLLIGLALQVFATACLEVTFTLYLMDHIPRRELTHFEPLRVFFAAGAWALGPWLGVYLGTAAAPWAPFAVSGAGAVVMLGYFWFLRLTDNPAVAPAKGPPPSPLRYLPHFFAQPRLRLAWVLAVGRAGWWAMFFVYAPIYAVTSGLGEVAGGAIVSIGTASFFAVPLWGWLGRRYGLRRLLLVGYLISAVTTLGVAAAAGAPWLAAAILIGAAIGTGTIDGAGNVPFLRAVRPLERSEMTTVFATYRDTSQLAPPGVFAVLLTVFQLPAVFVASGLGMLILAGYTRYLPRRL